MLSLSVTDLKKKLVTLLPGEKDMQVDLTLHGISVGLIEDFALQVVKPYYAGNLSEALKDLMQKTVADQEFIRSHTKA